MPFIETATTYVLDALLQNEEFKKFPQDFVTESVKWVRSWFIKDDPITEAVVNLPGNEAAKEAIVKAKLPALLEQPDFKKELEAKLAEYERHAATIQTDNSQRQSVDGNTVSAGGNVNFSPQQYAAHGNIQVTNYHYTSPPPPEAPPIAVISKPIVSNGVKDSLRNLIGNNQIKEAIALLKGVSAVDAEFQKMVLHQSANWENLRHDEMMGIIGHSEAGLVRNKIVNALLGLINELREA